MLDVQVALLSPLTYLAWCNIPLFCYSALGGWIVMIVALLMALLELGRLKKTFCLLSWVYAHHQKRLCRTCPEQALLGAAVCYSRVK